MAATDEVRRALVRADVRAVAQRTELPEKLVMAIVVNNGWDVAAAEQTITRAMRVATDRINQELESKIIGGMLTGGGPGGGKSDLIYRIRPRGTLLAPRGLVITCVS